MLAGTNKHLYFFGEHQQGHVLPFINDQWRASFAQSVKS